MPTSTASAVPSAAVAPASSAVAEPPAAGAAIGASVVAVVVGLGRDDASHGALRPARALAPAASRPGGRRR